MVISPEPEPARPTAQMPIEIVLGDGAVVRVGADVDEGVLRRVLRVLEGSMIAIAPSTRVWLAWGRTDMRKGFDGLAALVQEKLERNPFDGHLFVFRGRRGDLLKVLWFDGQGLCLFAKRLERGRFVWPSPADGKVTISQAQLAMLLEGIDWRMPTHTWQPELAR